MSSIMVFRTFQKVNSKGFQFGKLLNFLLIINFLIIIGIYIMALFPAMYRYKDSLLERSFIFIVGLIVLFLIRVVYYIFSKGKNKNLEGILKLSENDIELNSKKYPLAEIKHLRFIGNDVKGDFRGYISKGTNNEIVLSLKNGEEISSVFEQTSENQLKNSENLLFIYRSKGLLSEANFDNILNNTNYY